MTLTPALVITPKWTIQWKQQMMTAISLQQETSVGGQLEFCSSCLLPLQLFQEHFTSSGCSKCQRTGLQCSPIDVKNTLIRAWREIFKNTLLDKIVCNTIKAKWWQDIERKDLEAFIFSPLCFCHSKKEGQAIKWFLENCLLESPTIKKILSGGCKFFTIF
jgi:hypothetical protein